MTEQSDTPTFEEARQIAKRFIDGHFNNPGEHPRMSIPADVTRDDDIRLHMFIDWSESELSRLRADLSARDAELSELKAWKESAINVMPDMQAIGRALDVQLGDAVHDKILLGIESLRARLAAVEKERDTLRAVFGHHEDARLTRIGWLDTLLKEIRQNSNAFTELAQEDPDAFLECLSHCDAIVRDAKPFIKNESTY